MFAGLRMGFPELVLAHQRCFLPGSRTVSRNADRFFHFQGNSAALPSAQCCSGDHRTIRDGQRTGFNNNISALPRIFIFSCRTDIKPCSETEPVLAMGIDAGKFHRIRGPDIYDSAVA